MIEVMIWVILMLGFNLMSLLYIDNEEGIKLRLFRISVMIVIFYKNL